MIENITVGSEEARSQNPGTRRTNGPDHSPSTRRRPHFRVYLYPRTEPLSFDALSGLYSLFRPSRSGDEEGNDSSSLIRFIVCRLLLLFVVVSLSSLHKVAFFVGVGWRFLVGFGMQWDCWEGFRGGWDGVLMRQCCCCSSCSWLGGFGRVCGLLLCFS